VDFGRHAILDDLRAHYLISEGGTSLTLWQHE